MWRVHRSSLLLRRAVGGSQRFSSKPTKAQPEQKSGGGFGLTLLSTLIFGGGALSYLTYEKLDGNPTALHIASQPVLSDIIPVFANAFQQLGLGPAQPPSSAKISKEVQEESSKLVDHQSQQSTGTFVEPDPVAEATDAQADPQQIELENELFRALEAESRDSIDEEMASQARAEAERTDLVADQSPEHHVVPVESPSSASPAVNADAVHSQSSTSSFVHPPVPDARSSALLKQELEQLMLRDLHSLDAPALRLRVSQLATELFERLAWENVRIQAAVRETEDGAKRRYEELMAQQKAFLQLEIDRLKLEQDQAVADRVALEQQVVEEKFNQQLQNALRAQAEGVQQTINKALEEQQAVLSADFQAQANHHVALLRKQHNDQLLQTQDKLETLNAQLSKYTQILDGLGQSVQAAQASKAVSTAVLLLESLLSQPAIVWKKRGQNVRELVKEVVETASAGDRENGVITAVVGALPPRVQSEGALTLPELQVRFSIMRDEARKAALAPEDAPKLLGQVVGTVLAKVSFAPSGFIAGPGVEETLARAAYYLERGRLKQAVDEVKGMQGYARTIADDWVSLAEDRLVVDTALKALKAEALVLHRSSQV